MVSLTANVANDKRGRWFPNLFDGCPILFDPELGDPALFADAGDIPFDPPPPAPSDQTPAKPGDLTATRREWDRRDAEESRQRLQRELEEQRNPAVSPAPVPKPAPGPLRQWGLDRYGPPRREVSAGVFSTIRYGEAERPGSRPGWRERLAADNRRLRAENQSLRQQFRRFRRGVQGDLRKIDGELREHARDLAACVVREGGCR